MKILDNTKTLTQLASDTSNGLGHIHPLSCTVTEVLNGEYEADLTVSSNEKHFSLLSVGSLLEIELDAIRGKQIFEVYFISRPINEIVSVKCQHITYRLNKVPVGAFDSTGAVSTVNNLLSHVIGTTEFTMTTDITNTTSVFTLDIPRYFRECLGGYEGSILDVFRGEYEWDNLTIKMLAHRGSDEGVRIAYGKNLADFNQEENNQEVYTSVLGYAKVDDILYTGNVYDKIISTNKRVKIVDFSSDFNGTTPTVSELTDKAEEYATTHDIESPQVNISISFVPLYQTEEYKNIAPLERVNLGDTVHVYFEKIGVEATSRVIKTTWNVLTGKYDSVELGSLRASLNTVLEEQKQDILKTIDTDQGFVEAELNQLGSLIINGLGLFKTTETLGDGSTRIYLHNKPLLADSNIQYYISANGLVVSTDYGQTWNAGFNPDGSAVLNALSANIIRALQIYGSYIQGSQIVFGDMTDKYIIAQPYSINNNPVGVSFDGTGYIRMQPQESFEIDNVNSSDNIYNKFLMDKGNNKPYINLINYDNTHSYYEANKISLEANVTSLSQTMNRTRLMNNNYGLNTLANQIELQAANDVNRLNLQNNYLGQTMQGNYLSLATDSYGNHVYFYNYMPNSYNRANSLTFESDGSTNRAAIWTHDPDSGSESNVFEMTKTSSLNSISFDVRRAGIGLGGMSMTRFADGHFEINLTIYNQTVQGQAYKGCSIKLDSSTGNVEATGTNFKWNNSTKW